MNGTNMLFHNVNLKLYLRTTWPVSIRKIANKDKYLLSQRQFPACFSLYGYRAY